MRAFSTKLRGRAVASILIAAMIAIPMIAPNADSTDLTTPSFLVATRDLQDPLFQHAVVLMVPSTEPPLLAGLIINNPAKERVRDIFPQVRELKGPDETIYTGGPVELNDVPVLHQHRELSVIFRSSSAQSSATRVCDDVYVATGRDAIAAVLKDPRVTDLRVISGKAQWLRDQLSSEVMAGAWYVVPAKADLIFGDPKDLWSTLVKGGDLEEARARTAPELNLPSRRLDGTNWQRQISPN
jgi:putative transcriptional regulator